MTHRYLWKSRLAQKETEKQRTNKTSPPFLKFCYQVTFDTERRSFVFFSQARASKIYLSIIALEWARLEGHHSAEGNVPMKRAKYLTLVRDPYIHPSQIFLTEDDEELMRDKTFSYSMGR